MESNWQMNQSLTPNIPNWQHPTLLSKTESLLIWLWYQFSETNRLSANVYFNAQSGNPFSWGFVNSTIANTGQAAGLAYILKMLQKLLNTLFPTKTEQVIQ
jgi:hypothetical protein